MELFLRSCRSLAPIVTGWLCVRGTVSSTIVCHFRTGILSPMLYPLNPFPSFSTRSPESVSSPSSSFSFDHPIFSCHPSLHVCAFHLFLSHIRSNFLKYLLFLNLLLYFISTLLPNHLTFISLHMYKQA